MKIKGFTLAEVLIVLTILGVIAAMTLPALNTNVQRQQAGPALMRAISTLETANALVAQEHDFYNFAESCHNYLDDCFEPFVKEKLGAANFDENIEYRMFGRVFGEDTLHLPNGYTTPNGFVYYINDNTLGENSSFFSIWVDINGNKRPNVVGKDLFFLYLLPNNEGSNLYALGSTALYELDSSSYTPTWKEVCDNPEVLDGRRCGGSIVDNGGRVIYPW